MRVCLYSKDATLLELCREVVSGLSCSVFPSDPGQRESVDANVLIWDWDEVAAAGDQSDWCNRNAPNQIFLVSRGRIREFLRRMPLGAGSTLVKPIGRATLRIFLEQAVLRVEPNTSDPSSRDLLQCLLEANLKMQEYDHDRTNFLARAVHDFRAPLTAIGGYCGMMLEEALGELNSQQVDVLQRMQRSVKKLTRMAEEMFQLSVGKQVQRQLELQEAAIESCVRHACDEVATTARDRGITLRLNLSEPGGTLYFAPREIEQVLINLLENACKFTPRGGQIEVRAYPVNPHLSAGLAMAASGDTNRGAAVPRSQVTYRVDVSDTGTGISEEHLESVFEEYSSYSGSRDRSGGGLGLAICKMILRAHGGRIWAENHPNGARISFALPLGDLSRRKQSDRQPRVDIDAQIVQAAS